MKISMIAAMANNSVIGADNDMPWHLPADLKHFKSVTLGKPVIMGRKTYQSIGRALPGRTNIVISKDADAAFEGAIAVQTIENALISAGDVDEVMIIGGGSIYQACLPIATRLYLTFIDLQVDGDTYFPDYINSADWREIERTAHSQDQNNHYNYEFVTFDRA